MKCSSFSSSLTKRDRRDPGDAAAVDDVAVAVVWLTGAIIKIWGEKKQTQNYWLITPVWILTSKTCLFKQQRSCVYADPRKKYVPIGCYYSRVRDGDL